jgi:hypothetical protein
MLLKFVITSTLLFYRASTEKMFSEAPKPSGFSVKDILELPDTKPLTSEQASSLFVPGRDLTMILYFVYVLH